ncbi:MAG: hypothetical protein EAZ57_04250 [Cytophagales bacterium]|nr:MAG: hypothetical protein EAZ67_05270 [Cytophagales bacterium]TAF61210.1 MAG: hypothetical protein EAZ57_04250 [Cytophagales bacterium]
MKHSFTHAIFVLSLWLGLFVSAYAQTLEVSVQPVAVPYLLIIPDSRSGGMGDVGAAISPDPNTTFYNPSKLAFLKNRIGFGVSYVPWLGNLGAGMGLSYLSSYYKLNQRQVVGFAMKYFDQGSIDFTDNQGRYLGTYRPNEFNIDGTFAMKLSPYFSIAGTGRFIYSNLTGGFDGEPNFKPGAAAAVDLSVFYTQPTKLAGQTGIWSWGANFSNMGSKLVYSNPQEPDYLPTNLRLGTAYTHNLDAFSTLTLALDLNKLFVPAPTDSLGQWKRKGLFTAIGSSVADESFSEEMKGFNYSLGAEYWYNNLFALRAGYFYEHPSEGARTFLSLGAGIRYQQLGVDFSYLLSAGRANNPLSNTLRFSLIFTFEGRQKNSGASEPVEESPILEDGGKTN